MKNDVEHLCMHLLASYLYGVFFFFEKYLFYSFAYYLIGVFIFCKNSLHILHINPGSDVGFANILSHSVGHLFHFLKWFPLKDRSF